VARHDWLGWHDDYDRPGSSLARRLAPVRGRISDALDIQPPGPVTVISMCAGQGRDLLGVLPDHPRRADVTARLVELDPRNVAIARQAVERAGLAGVHVVAGDAALCSAYAGAVPADIVLACGIFGNITDDDIRRTVANLPRLCGTGGTVVWTRHTGGTDITPTIREWFADSGFHEIGFDTEDGYPYGVGTHRLDGPALPFQPDLRLFEFVDHQKLPG
jgi:hypothetical protein